MKYSLYLLWVCVNLLEIGNFCTFVDAFSYLLRFQELCTFDGTGSVGRRRPARLRKPLSRLDSGPNLDLPTQPLPPWIKDEIEQLHRLSAAS